MSAKPTNYYVIPCDGGVGVNAEFRFYFRLYKSLNGKEILVEQGGADLLERWKKEFGAELEADPAKNPYPKLD